MNTKTAIVVFADVSKSEARSKKLLPELNEQANMELLRFMTNQTCFTARASGFPVLLVNRALQHGRSFGERIQSAFNHAFNQGFEQIILIGNDCTDLKVEDLREAAQQIHNNQVVLGPDHRGGTWLIGMNKATYDNLDLTHFSWQQNTLLSELCWHFEKANTTLLSSKNDLNSALDLRRFMQRLKSASSSISAKQCFLHFIDALHHFYFINANNSLINYKHFVQRIPTRGPPCKLAA